MLVFYPDSDILTLTIKMIMTNKLTYRVFAKNRANKLVNEIAPKSLAVLSKWIGKKVTKADGTLLQKIKDSLAPFQESQNNHCQVWYNASRAAIWLNVKTWETTPEGTAHYADTALCLAQLNFSTGVLESVAGFVPMTTDYSVEAIELARKKVQSAKENLRYAENELCGFGEWDN